jgi:hypothetical protein
VDVDFDFGLGCDMKEDNGDGVAIVDEDGVEVGPPHSAGATHPDAITGPQGGVGTVEDGSDVGGGSGSADIVINADGGGCEEDRFTDVDGFLEDGEGE